MTTRQRIRRWVDEQVPKECTTVTILPTAEWGDGFQAKPERRKTAVDALTNVLGMWEEDRQGDDTLVEWLESCLPLPIADEDA